MIRGTSQQFRFKLPYDISKIDTMTIMFWQEGDNANEEVFKTKTERDKDYLEKLDNRTLCVRLDPEDTLDFITDKKAYVQFKGTTHDGFVFGSRAKEFTVYPMKESSKESV